MADGDLSMLDKMASGLMERKEAAAARAKLTPVKGEKAPAPTVVGGLPVTNAMFPNDIPAEVIVGVIREVERQIGHLQEVVDALRLVVGQEPPTLTVVPDPKAAEKAADAKAAAAKPLTADTTAEEFTAKQQAQMAAAQASAFKPTVADSTVEGGEDPSPLAVLGAAIREEDRALAARLTEAVAEAAGWVCPDHGTRQDTKSRKGRAMVACGSYPAECQKFEMPS